MASSAHLSIGEVLEELRGEFSDVTISKIRFLESQGLIDPERTASGYRRFYATDVERLRFILREQRENFLPLKVIKERLDDLDAQGGKASRPAPDRGVADRAGSDRPARTADGETAAPAKRRTRRKAPATEPLFETARRAAELGEARAATAGISDDDGADDLQAAAAGATMTRAELARAAGVTDDELARFEEFGLVTPALTSRDRVLFDDDALAVARIAAAFMRHGIEPRHLRMYRAFAEREAGLFEQVLLPYRRQRNPEAQARTQATLGELAGLGRQLRTALLRQTMRRSLTG